MGSDLKIFNSSNRVAVIFVYELVSISRPQMEKVFEWSYSLTSWISMQKSGIDVSTKLSNGSPIQLLTVASVVYLHIKASSLTHVEIEIGSHSKAVLMICLCPQSQMRCLLSRL